MDLYLWTVATGTYTPYSKFKNYKFFCLSRFHQQAGKVSIKNVVQSVAVAAGNKTATTSFPIALTFIL